MNNPMHAQNVEKPEVGDSKISSATKESDLLSVGTLKKDLNKKAFRGSAAVMTAEVISNIIRFGSMAVLARLLMPQDFGLLAMVTAVTVFAERIKDFGLGDATVQARNITNEEINGLFWINFFVCISLALILSGLSKPIAWFYKDTRLTAVTIIIASTFIFSGLTIQHEALLRRQLRFGTLALIQLSSTILSTLFAIVLAYNGFGYWALVAREFLRAVIYVFGIWIKCPWRPSLPKWNKGIGHFLSFGKDVTIFNFLSFLSLNVDKILLGRLYGSFSVGLYSVSNQIIAMPISFLQYPMKTVALPALSAVQEEPLKFFRLQHRMFQTLIFFTMPIVVFFTIFAENIVGVFLGSKWIGAAPLLRIFAIGAFVEPIGFTIGPSLVALGRTKVYLRLGVIGSIFRVACLGIGSLWGTTGIAFGASAGIVISLSFWLLLGLNKTPIRISDVLKGVMHPAICSLGTGLVLIIIRQYSTWGYQQHFLPLFIILGFIIYILLWVLIPGGKVLLKDYFTKYFSMFLSLKKR